tara:strand:+ start:36 stop:140 length:105 start_codon:yes stop_codon:yes gene_type:complete
MIISEKIKAAKQRIAELELLIANWTQKKTSVKRS